MPKFQLKFIDVMIGVVLGIGFQFWTELREPWQYIAFIFAYLNIIDYWIDYNPLAKKYALKLEIDVILHTLIIFSMFLLIFGTQKTVSYFLMSFAFYRLADILWIWRIKSEHRVPHSDLMFLNTWFLYDFVEMIVALGLYFIIAENILGQMTALIVFICVRAVTRFIESKSYKKVFYSV
ncbi:MAG TPA: hypothetical protein VJH67_00610 [Candidatus Paceibacterota bacterium]